jgi:NAD+ kinase
MPENNENMKIALYTRTPNQEATALLAERLGSRGIETEEIVGSVNRALPDGLDMLISVGGDGTLLSSVHLLGDSNIPVLGVNFGHLGFLTSANRDDVELMADCLKNGDYNVETRTLLKVEAEAPEGKMPGFVLNEVYLHRPLGSALLRVRVYVDNQYLANYSGDGLIVATPTGSTAYSLSCGGPILTPDSGSLVITPIGAHTLTLRPIVLSDKVCISLLPDESCDELTLGTDSSSCVIRGGSEVKVCRHPHALRLIRLPGQNFFTALQNKLLWGAKLH